MGNGFQSELKSALDEPMREMRETADLVKKAADPALVAEESESEARLRSEADAAMLAATLDTPVSDASLTISDPAAAGEITSANDPKINQIAASMARGPVEQIPSCEAQEASAPPTPLSAPPDSSADSFATPAPPDEPLDEPSEEST
jgi:sec-independent protein translocase protein TatB